MKKRLLLLPALFTVAYAADRTGVTSNCLQQPIGTIETTIRRVVDGDTLVDECDRRIRVLGIDTPERDTRLGPLTTKFVESWLQKSDGFVDLAICDAQPTDYYGRLLARVFRKSDGRDLSRDLLTTSHAWIMAIPPCGELDVASDMKLMRQSMTSQRGIWEQGALQPVPAKQARQTGGYVLVRDRVTKVKTNKDNTTLVLGSNVKERIFVKIYNHSLSRLSNYGFTPHHLNGKTIDVMGKLRQKSENATPYIYLDFPEMITFYTPE